MRSESALPGRAEPWRQQYACRHIARAYPRTGAFPETVTFRFVLGATIWRLVTYVFCSRGSWIPGRSDRGICRTDRSPCVARACCIRSPRSVLMNDLPTRPIDGLWVGGIRNLRDDRIPPYHGRTCPVHRPMDNNIGPHAPSITATRPFRIVAVFLGPGNTTREY